MKLKSIEINGFKSFADNVKLNFESNITAIIGPNGSGKSNVSDAVRWVLGEQSIKTLRASKMEDVIFSGTSQKVKKNRAVVSITFDNSDNLIPIDYKEITISRTLYRTGESEYRINKSLVKLKEIKELFLDTGIGKEGYSLIGQGRIEEIINGKSEDRRLIFEQACGTAKIKYQKNESEKKLTKAKDNLTRLKDIIIQNEKRCDFLKIQAKKAKRGMQLLEEIKKADFSISYKDYNNYTTNIKKYTEKLDELKNEHTTVSKELDFFKKKLIPLKERLKDVSLLVDNSIKESSSDEIKKNELINKKQLLLERNKFIFENKKNLSSLNIQNKNTLSDILKNIEKVKLSVDEKNVLRKKFLENRNSIKLKLSKKSLELEKKLENLDIIKKDKIKLEKEINLLETEKKANDIINEDIENKILENQKKITNLNFSKDKLLKEIDFSIEKLEENKKNILDIDKKIIDLSNEKNSFIKTLDFLNKENLNINNEISYKDKEISMLKNYIRNYEGYNKSVQELFKLCESKKHLKNMIFGTLGDLISVEEKYKKAIDTVLSSNLQAIVVNDENDAKIIIEQMKENKIGRLNFFPISKIFSKNETFDLKDENILAFANNVITCDQKYRNIVNYFLSKTVICKNLDVAIEISKKYKNKFKIVTLDADIISTWGSISGGYKSNKNSFSVIGRKSKLNTLSNEFNLLKENFKKNNLEILQLEKKVSYTKDEILQLENKKETISNDIIKLDKEIYKNRLEFDQISNKILEIQSFKTSSLTFSDEKNKKLEDDKKIILKFDLDFKAEQNKIDSLKQEINSLEKEEINAINDLDFIDRDINILSNRENELIENKASIEKKLNNENEKIVDFDCKINENLKEIEKNEKIILKLEEKIKNLNKIIFENKALRDELSLETEQASNKFSSINERFFFLENEIEKDNLKISNMKNQLDSLILNLSEEYSLDYNLVIKKIQEFKDEKFTKESIKKLKEELRNLGTFSCDSIQEYDNVNLELQFQKNQEIDLKNSIDDINKIILKLETEMKKTFLKEFENINERFSNIFKILFNGGEASLKLDSEDALTCGVEIIAKPVGKKMQVLSLLSGGEKSLTAVALLFAIFQTNPSPFCILDEVDAALDDANILRYIDYLKTFLNKTQFIMVTHRKPTMEMADMIYGVTMEQKGISKVVSMKFN
ncbi:hypothetical protein HMPREF3188_01525 [Tissierellia bacterium KA00581]|nr:hypothetical protein HMPREF3188_01525 [Tissierellia bacterium KA00581]